MHAPTRSLPASLPLAMVGAVLAYAAVLFVPQVLGDGDTFWHIATGEWMLDHGTVPHADPFSFSVPGRPWVTLEWLSELLMGLAWRVGGWGGVVVLFGLAAALTVAVLAGFLERRVERLPALLLLVVGGVCISPGLLARPHLLALLPLVLWTIGLIVARGRRRRPSLLLLPLMTVWANLHGSFVFGLALAVPFALEAVLAAEAGWLGVAKGWGLFIVAAVVASMITPHGWEGLVFPLHLMSMRYMSQIYEWQPTNFATFQPLEVALAAALYVALTRPLRLSPLRAIILIGLLHMALQHQRQQVLAGVVGTLIFAEALGGAPAGVVRPRGGAAIWACAVAVSVLALTGLRAAYPIVRGDTRTAPVSAVAHLPADLARTAVFNDYGFGGYLIFKGIRPFVDGRADMYGDDFLAANLAALVDRESFERLCEQYHFRWTMLYADSPSARLLDSLPGWRRLYSDRIAVVHVRTDAAP